MSPEHKEKHFTDNHSMRDVIIGMSDGLTVPFALAAGLSGATIPTAIIVTAGLAEIIAGSISMGLGGYLAAKSDVEHYEKELAREQREVAEKPEVERHEVAELFRGYGLSDEEIQPVISALEKHPTGWVDFMMRFELGLEKPDPKRAVRSGLTIAISYLIGGFIPLAPYMVFHDALTAFWFSVATTLTALIAFGYAKAHYLGAEPIRSTLRTVTIGVIAAAAAFFIARLFS